MRTFYDLLDVPRDADPAAVKSAYRKLARATHPDVNPGAEALFRCVQAAYDTLGSAQARAAYDAELAATAGPRTGGGPASGAGASEGPGARATQDAGARQEYWEQEKAKAATSDNPWTRASYGYGPDPAGPAPAPAPAAKPKARSRVQRLLGWPPVAGPLLMLLGLLEAALAQYFGVSSGWPLPADVWKWVLAAGVAVAVGYWFGTVLLARARRVPLHRAEGVAGGLLAVLAGPAWCDLGGLGVGAWWAVLTAGWMTWTFGVARLVALVRRWRSR